MEFSNQAAPAIQATPGRYLQNIAVQPTPTAEQARLAFLTRRFGLAPSSAALFAPLAFGGARS